MPITRSRYIAQFAIHSNNITDGTVTLADLATIYTDNIVEATNIYFTNTRVQNYLTNISGNLVPAGNALYDLGSESSYWRDLYLSGNSLYLGNILIRDESGTVTFTNTVSQTSISVGGATSLTRYIYTAANNQSVFTGPDANNRSLYLLDPGLALVYLNGTLLTQNSDYTAYTTNVTIAEGLQANDVVSVLVGGTVDTQTSLVSSKRYTYNTASLTTVVSGADSLGQTLDLSYPEKTHVFVNGILMMPTTDYTAYASNITFTSSILAGSTVIVIDNLSQVTSNVVNSINGLQGQITLTTSNVTEGTNLYFSNARVSNAFVSSGTANAVLYLNAGNVVTSGSALTFDGTNLGLGGSPNVAGYKLQVLGSTGVVGIQFTRTGAAPGNWSIAAGGAANTLQFYDQASNSERLRIDSSGNVGIGTTSPSAKLDVSGNAAISGTVTMSGGTANGVLYLNGSKAATSGNTLIYDGSALTSSGGNPSAYFKIGSTAPLFAMGWADNTIYHRIKSAGGANDGIQIQLKNDAASLVLSNTPDFFFIINGSEQMRLTSTGLGIGTSSPLERLDVRTTGSGRVSIRLASGGTNQGYISYFDSGQYLAFGSGASTGSGVNGGEQLVLNNAGNLGLGVAPSAWGNTAKAFTIRSTGSGIEGSISNSGVTNAVSLTSNSYYASGWKYVYSGGSFSAGRYDIEGNTHSWYNAPSGTAGNAITFTQAMTLDASGRLQLGGTVKGEYGWLTLGNTSDTASALQFLASSSSGSSIQFGDATSGSGQYSGYINYNHSSDVMQFGTATAERARITSGGDLLVGTTSGVASGYRMVVNGTAYTTTGAQQDIYSGHTLIIQDTNDNNFVAGKSIALGFNMYCGGGGYTTHAKVVLVKDNGTSANQSASLQFWTRSGANNATSDSCKLIIGSTGTITFNSYGSGTLTTNSTGVISASDGRFKNKTRDLTDGLTKIRALAQRAMYYSWDEDVPMHTEYEEIGWAAQDVAAIIPEASPEPEQEGKFKNYNDRAIIAYMAKAIDELAAQVESIMQTT